MVKSVRMRLQNVKRVLTLLINLCSVLDASKDFYSKNSSNALICDNHSVTSSCGLSHLDVSKCKERYSNASVYCRGRLGNPEEGGEKDSHSAENLHL